MEKGVDFFKLAQNIDAEITIGDVHQSPYQNGWTKNDSEFICYFDGAETKESENDKYLSSTLGYGQTVGKAIRDYAKKIQGKLLVFNAMNKKERKEIPVPKKLF